MKIVKRLVKDFKEVTGWDDMSLKEKVVITLVTPLVLALALLCYFYRDDVNEVDKFADLKEAGKK